MESIHPERRASVILSFDFDGTLHDPDGDPPVPARFFQRIEQLRHSHGAVWGINTGRSIEHMIEGMEESRFPFPPDWIVAREREILFPGTDGQWIPHDSWNQRCESEIHSLFDHARSLLDHLRREVEQHTGAQWMNFQGEPAGIISRTEEEMEWIVRHISPMVADTPALAWQRNSIYLRFGHRDFQKGSSLAEIANLYQIPVKHRFAMGDSHNDMEMLDLSCAAMISCPGNAVAEVRDKVLSQGGLVTSEFHGHGATEALEHFFPF